MSRFRLPRTVAGAAQAQAGIVTDVCPSVEQLDTEIVNCEAGDGSIARFSAPRGRWHAGDAVFMDRQNDMVRSERLTPDGHPIILQAPTWTDPPRSNLQAAVPVTGRLRVPDALKGRVVAVQSAGMGEYRCVARFPRGQQGTLEGEFTVDWEAMPGMRVTAEQEDDGWRIGVVFRNVGPYMQFPVWDVLWGEARYGVGAPMIDDSQPVSAVVEWIESHGGHLERIDDDQRGRVWRIRVDTGRGSMRHVKFPRESWRAACKGAGVGWPAPAERWDDEGPTVVGPDPWALPERYETAMREEIEDARLDGHQLEFTLPSSVGFTGEFCGYPVSVSPGLPDDKMQVAVLDKGRGQTLRMVDV